MSASPRVLLTALVVLAGCGDETPSTAPPPAWAPVSPISVGTAALYLGVWGAAPDAVWMVGGDNDLGAVAHFDGERLALEAIPPGPRLWWVAGVDAAHVWAVGEGGRILRRDPTGWREEPSGLGEKAILWGVWAGAEDDVWAVGGSNRRGGPKAVVLRSGGDGRWTPVDDPAFPADFNFYKVWGGGADDVHIVGEGGVTVRWDGQRFRRVDTGVSAILFTVHGRAAGPRLAVGGSASGLAFSFEDGKWRQEPLPVTLSLNGVFVRPDGTAVACGERGVLLVRDVDGRWSPVGQEAIDAVGHRTLHAVWGDEVLWVVGGDLSRGTDGVILSSLRSPLRLEIP